MRNSSPTELEADSLLTPRWLVPMDTPNKVLEGHSLALAGSRIVAIGPTSELEANFPCAQQTTLPSHMLLPGFINAHTHAPMNLLRGFADDLPLQPWLEQKIWPSEARFMSEDYVSDGSRLAIAEMLLGGTTTFTDMYFFADSTAQVADELGIRAHLASPVFDFPTVWARDSDEYISKATALLDRYRHHPRINVLFGPHAPYTVSDGPLRKLAVLAEELDVGLHIHLHENAAEIAQAVSTTGLRPLQRLHQLDLLSPRLQAVHMTQLTADEIELLAAHKVNVVHCPASNMKLASGVCPVHSLISAGVNVALGTDGSASNNSLDILSDTKLAALLAKCSTGDASALNAWEALAMATRNGAIALGQDHELGTLEVGKLADLVAIDLDHPFTQPVFDPVSTVVYSAQRAQVSHVWVHGQLLVREHRLTRLDYSDCLQRAKRWGTEIAASTPR
jgi:5-methylthioadenosine/S-adenosylhomocysteine deaminase